MDARDTKNNKSISHQRKIIILENRKAEEYYSDAQWLADRAIEVSLSRTQVSGMLTVINTTSSSAEFLNYLKRQVGKVQIRKKRDGDAPLTRASKLLELIESNDPTRLDQKKEYSPWLKQVQTHLDSEEEKAFGEVLIDRLEEVRKEAMADAQKNEMGAEDKARLCVLYLRQFLKAFEAHYLYHAVITKDGIDEPVAGLVQ